MDGLMLYLAFLVPPMLLGLWAQSSVKRTFRRYAQVDSSSGLTGAEVARMILDRNGLGAVQIEPSRGELSDHYDPRSRTVALSEPVYASRSVSAVSVAAHEVGHAIQHAKAYAPMRFRSALFPVAALSTNMFMYLLIGGVLLGSLGLIQIAIVLFAFGVLFQLVTLPVEFDASRRARAQLGELGLVPAAEVQGTRKVLNAAAMTYVAAALAAVSQLAYFVLVFLGNRN